MQQITNEQIDIIMKEYTDALKENLQIQREKVDLEERNRISHMRLVKAKESVRDLKIEY